MKILLTTDGSRFSDEAVAKIATMIANTPETQVRILSVYEKLGPLAGEPFGAATQYYQQAEDAARKLAEDSVANAAAGLRARFPELKFGLLTEIERGRAARVIVEKADAWNADLIVMGSHGYGFWERSLLGSVSDTVVHHANCSVLIVRVNQ